eukprot:jgi/Hompol1/182/HPOL_002447-RA
MKRNEKISSASATSVPLQNLPLNDALDNVKTFEPCKEIKALLDSGTPESELPDINLARLVKLWMIVSKQEGVESKNALRNMKESGGDGPQPTDNTNDPLKAKQSKIDKDKEKERAKSSNAKKPAGGAPAAGAAATAVAANAAQAPAKAAAAAAKPADAPRPESAVPPSDLSKRKTKLRDRGGKSDTKPVAIGDEPADGPDVYYLLRDFDSPGFYNTLMEETEVQVNTLFRIEEVQPPKRAQTPSESAPSNANAVWSSLRSTASKASEGSWWKQTTWCTIQSTEIKDYKDLFDIIARRIYGIIARHQDYHNYYDNDISIPVPEFDSSISVKSDMRYYDFLLSTSMSFGIVDEDLILALMLEHLNKSNSGGTGTQQTSVPPSSAPEEDTVDNYGSMHDTSNEDANLLALYFDQQTSKLAITAREYAAYGNVGLISNPKGKGDLKLVQFHNENLLVANAMHSLTTLGHNPSDLLQQIRNVSSMRRFPYFLGTKDQNAEMSQPSIDISALIIEKMLQKSEFERVCSVKLAESTMEHVLSQMDFQTFLKDKCDPETSWAPDFHSWCWSEMHDSDVFILQKAIIERPILSTHFSKRASALFLTLMSPGPIGCYIYQSNEPIQMIHIQCQTTYMYPMNGIIIRVDKRVSKAIGNSCSVVVSWNGNVFSFSGDNGGKNGSYITASFSNGDTVSCSEDTAGFHAQASTAKGQLLTYLPSGGVCQKFVGNNTEMYTKLKDAEVCRIVMPKGTGVIRYLDDECFETLFADGSVTYMSPREAYRTDCNGLRTFEKGPSAGKVVQLKVAQTRSISSNHVSITREDMVTLTGEEDGRIVVQHADRTRFVTTNGVGTTVENPGDIAVEFDQSKCLCRIDASFSIEKSHASAGINDAFTPESCEFKVHRNDLKIQTDRLGKARIELSSFGYKDLGSPRSLEIDWHSGTLRFEDMDGRIYAVDEHGKAEVNSDNAHAVNVSRSFGGKMLRERLQSSTSVTPPTGNMPRLFVIHHDGSSEEFLVDDDVQRYFMSNASSFKQTNEEVSEDPASVAVTTIFPSTKGNESDQTLVYRQLSPQTRSQIQSELKEYQIRRSSRSTPADLPSKPGDTMDDHADHVETIQRPLTYGQNRAATEEAIVLKYWLRQDLALRNRHHTVSGEETVKARGSWRKPRVLTLETPKQQPAKDFKEQAARKAVRQPMRVEGIDVKYFDAPEGKAFLQSQASIVIAAKQEIPKSPDAAAKQEESTDSKPAVATVPKSPAKPRKLHLPAAIRGAKPGAEPNEKFIRQEAEARRKIKTASMANHTNKQNASYGLGGFVVLPAYCKFGNVEQGHTYQVLLTLTNVGLDSTRFSIRQPKHKDLVHAEFKPGPVAPGMSAQIVIKLMPQHTGVPNAVDFTDEVQVVSESEILHIPITAHIKPREN